MTITRTLLDSLRTQLHDAEGDGRAVAVLNTLAALAVTGGTFRPVVLVVERSTLLPLAAVAHIELGPAQDNGRFFYVHLLTGTTLRLLPDAMRSALLDLLDLLDQQAAVEEEV